MHPEFRSAVGLDLNPSRVLTGLVTGSFSPLLDRELETVESCVAAAAARLLSSANGALVYTKRGVEWIQPEAKGSRLYTDGEVRPLRGIDRFTSPFGCVKLESS